MRNWKGFMVLAQNSMFLFPTSFVFPFVPSFSSYFFSSRQPVSCMHNYVPTYTQVQVVWGATKENGYIQSVETLRHLVLRSLCFNQWTSSTDNWRYVTMYKMRNVLDANWMFVKFLQNMNEIYTLTRISILVVSLWVPVLSRSWHFILH